MFELLIIYLPKLQDANNKSSERETRLNLLMRDFTDTVYDFIDAHPEMKLNRYQEILNESKIEWSEESMKHAEVSLLDGRTILALIVGIIRADRFYDGTSQRFFENGYMIKWLRRLEEIEGDVKE